MKKLFVILVAFLLLFAGCAEKVPKDQVLDEEVVLTIPEEPEKEQATEESAEEEHVTEEPYNEDEASMMEYGLEKEKIEAALKILDDPESYNDENLVISGNNGTRRIELVEDFITAVENNESAKVCGIMAGYTFPYYFELSYEPDSVIKTVQYSHYGLFAEEYLRVFDEEAFYCFLGKGGRTSFSFPKMQLFWDEKPEYSEDEVSDMPVTPEEAKETARKILLSGSGYSAYLSEIGAKKGFGSYGGVIPDDFSDKADEYDKILDARYEGTFGIDGKPYHLIVFYDGESDVGIYNYIGAEDGSTVFEVSMVDGGLMPVAYIPEPRIMLDKR